jgi:transcriptional regulator NrdR family protein
MQTEEEMKRYNDLIEKMESLKKYDAESFVKNITSVYQDFKSEEKVISFIILIIYLLFI